MTSMFASRHHLFLTLFTGLCPWLAHASDPTSIDTLPYDITRPGKYIVSTSLTTSSDGIHVLSDHVDIDLNGHTLSGPLDVTRETYGIVSFGRNHITVRNGSIQGFAYGLYISALVDGAAAAADLQGGEHRVEHLDVQDSTFRGIRVEGAKSAIDYNNVSNIGGATYIPNAYAIGIESYGPATRISNNTVEEIRGTGVTDKGEGVGISLTRFVDGSTLESNTIRNLHLHLDPSLPAWTGLSRSTYGIWVGGDGARDIMITHNTVENFWIGLTFKRSEQGAFANNHVSNSFIPYYLPNNHDFQRVKDLGGNTSDQGVDSLKFGRATAGQIELTEPPSSTYLPPLHRLATGPFLSVANLTTGDDKIVANGPLNMVDYWHPVFENSDPSGVIVDLRAGTASGCCGSDELVGIVAAQGTPFNDILQGNDENNMLAGAEGDDLLDGRGGDDYLFGDDGNDAIHGGAGSDVLIGGGGDDQLWGDGGSDIFVFWSGEPVGNDTIHDFSGSDGEGDLIDVAGCFKTFEQLYGDTQQIANDTVIVLSEYESIILKNYKREDLKPSDIVL